MQWQQDLTSYVRPQMRMTFLVHFYAYFGILEKICQIISKIRQVGGFGKIQKFHPNLWAEPSPSETCETEWMDVHCIES